MRRRNFLSGLMAAPFALKARFLALFQKRPVELCGAAIFGTFMPKAIFGNEHTCGRPSPFMRRLIRQAREANKNPRIDRKPVHCSLPRGHQGPHVLLNTR